MKTVGHPIRGWTTTNGFRFVVALYSLRMLFPAAQLVFSSDAAGHFAAFGFPPWVRWVLAISEMAGSVLLNFPRVFYVGCAILLLDLAAASAAHLKVGEHPTGFYLLAGVLVLLICLRWLVFSAPRTDSAGTRRSLE